MQHMIFQHQRRRSCGWRKMQATLFKGKGFQLQQCFFWIGKCIPVLLVFMVLQLRKHSNKGNHKESKIIKINQQE
jgi:hypothetical protein